MQTPLIIPLMAILATPQVKEGIKERVMEGGHHAEYAMELCMKDQRDMKETFYLEVADGTKGVYLLACQMLETTTGPFYAVKGEFQETPILDTLTTLFEEKGIKVVDDGKPNAE